MKKIFTLISLIGIVFSTNAQLSGTYTIDSKLPTKKTNFNNLTDATNALRFQEIEGDVTFELAAGFYYEPIILESVHSELGFNVTFTNSKHETVQFVNDGLSLMVSNSDNIDFSNLQFEAISTEMSSMVILTNADNISISSSEFVVDENSVNHKSLVAITSNSDNNILENNLLKGSAGVEISRLSNNNTLLSNNIYFSSIGVSVYSSIDNTLESNVLEGIDANSSTGVSIDGYVGELTLASNAILNVNEGLTQTVTFRPSEYKLTGNFVNNVIESTSSTIALTNNVDALQIAFNSFTSLNGSVLNVNEKIAKSITGINLFANNLLNESSEPLLVVSSSENFGNVDYNNIYNNKGVFQTKVGSVVSTSIAEWKTNMQADNSISNDPLFVSFDEKNYMLSENSPCIDAGPNAYDIGVLVDFDGDARGDVTEIGADEFNKVAFNQLMQEFQLALKK